MKLQQLKYLLAIVDNGLNITAAAERLYTSQPGVSKQLKLLEEELGLQLFTRKGKSLGGVTAAGDQVIDRARLIMQEVDNIRSLASDYYQEEEGSLSIATTHTQARYVLPDVIREFRKLYPKVGLNLHQGTSEQIADMVAANEIDFAIATGSRDLFSNLLLVPSYHWDRKIIVPKDHELTKLDGKASLHDLAKYPLVTYVFSFGGQSSLKRAFADEGLEPDVVFTARDADVIKTYVRMGLGADLVAVVTLLHGQRELELRLRIGRRGDHVQPPRRRIHLCGRVCIRGEAGGEVDLLAWPDGLTRRVDQTIPADEQVITCVRQVRDDIPTPVVGHDDAGELCR